ncbi:unnamed protein product [Moneuplotes crassus]|uniref:Uncharacterized protein n=1 Tax=Euplotes crassus TaxID=5936 RepID=A0AAD1XWY8_EUPCR|nr:unnamed protein product [Moneuplotes crassus]
MNFKSILGAVLLFTSVVMAVTYEPAFEIKSPTSGTAFTFLKGDQDGFFGFNIDHAKSSVNHLDSAAGVCYETQGDSQHTPVEGAQAFGFESVCLAFFTAEMACLEDLTKGSVHLYNSTVEERDGKMFWTETSFDYLNKQIDVGDSERFFPDITTYYDLSRISTGIGLPHFKGPQSFRCFIGGIPNRIDPLRREVDLSMFHEFSVTTGSASPSSFLKH